MSWFEENKCDNMHGAKVKSFRDPFTLISIVKFFKTLLMKLQMFFLSVTRACTVKQVLELNIFLTL